MCLGYKHHCSCALSICVNAGTVCSEDEDGEDLSKMVEPGEDSALHMLVSGKNFDEVCVHTLLAPHLSGSGRHPLCL